MPHGRLLQVFCDLEGFDVDKLFIVETVNQTEKNINKNISRDYPSSKNEGFMLLKTQRT